MYFQIENSNNLINYKKKQYSDTTYATCEA